MQNQLTRKHENVSDSLLNGSQNVQNESIMSMGSSSRQNENYSGAEQRSMSLIQKQHSNSQHKIQSNSLSTSNQTKTIKPKMEQAKFGITFGDGGFHKAEESPQKPELMESPVNKTKRDVQLHTIYENEPQDYSYQPKSDLDPFEPHTNNTAISLDSDFKSNMLLSFYKWPKIEKPADSVKERGDPDHSIKFKTRIH